ncbi:MAG TPA: response regulator transcription factor [Candidatus Kryptonia bacterium]
MADTRTVVIADDHPLFRAGVRQSLEKDNTLRIVGEVDNGADALTLIQDLKPDFAILDIQMPKLTGLEVAKRAEQIGLQTRVILLTMIDDRKIFLEAMECGVRGYVLKDSAVNEINHAIESISDDKYYISPSLSGLLVERRKGGHLPPELKELTPTEQRIVRLVAELKSNQEIADELFISKRTVENHKANISRKLKLDGTNSLLKLALKHKSVL